jgi:ABC-type multidrug transport system ATPase subunit
LLRTLNTGARAVLMTTHDLDRGWAMCGRALVLARGQIVHEARTTEVAAAAFRSEYRRVAR